MSSFSQDFVGQLQHLHEQDRGALAILRRSLRFAPGSYPPAYPYVERFVGKEREAGDPLRLALYLVAGLYALHPKTSAGSLASGLGELMHRRASKSIENRFIALLNADANDLAERLRLVVPMFAADGMGIDYALLFNDLAGWLNPHAPGRRDRIRQKWARDFYEVLAQYEPETSIIANAAE
jgi:CRISPR system Cascade subunit CasB